MSNYMFTNLRRQDASLYYFSVSTALYVESEYSRYYIKVYLVRSMFLQTKSDKKSTGYIFFFFLSRGSELLH